MTPDRPYIPIIGMAGSRYAAPTPESGLVRDRLHYDLVGGMGASRSQQIEPKVMKDAENVIATHDRAPLAQAQAGEIQEDRSKQEMVRYMSSMNETTRHNLHMVRQIVHAESPETLQSVDHIWQELKALSEANQNAKNGITNIMKKNREECNRIASAKIQETFDMLQDELNQKDKLFGLAQERSMALIQARKNVEAGLDRKTAGLHERLSRSQMEQSLMRDEIMGAKAQLAAAQKSEKNALKMAKESVKQAEVENQSGASLGAEIITLRATIENLQAKEQILGDKATEYEKLHQIVSEKLLKEQQKATALGSRLHGARLCNEIAKREIEKLVVDFNSLLEKNNSQAVTLSKLAEDLKKQKKKAATLAYEKDIQKLQNFEVKKEYDELALLKGSLEKQQDALNAELDKLKQTTRIAQEEAQHLSDKLQQVEMENDKVEAENNDLTAMLKKAKEEIATLQDTTHGLQATPITINNSDVVTTLKSQIDELTEQLANSEVTGSKWEEFGRNAMVQFREAKEKCKEFDNVQQQLTQVQSENTQLQAKITELQPVGGAVQGDKYWRDKYNELLADIEG